MQFFRPTTPPPGKSPSAPKPATASQARGEAVVKRLETAVKERQRLLAVEHSAPAPISEMAHQKGELVGRRIDSLTATQKDQP